MSSSHRAETHIAHDHQVIRLLHNGRGYELLANTGEAEKYRKGEIKHATSVLATSEIWYNHVRAEKPDPMDLAEHFPDQTYDQIVDKILREGTIQVTVSERKHEKDAAKDQLIDYIHQNYVDVVSKSPVEASKVREWLDKAHHKFTPPHSINTGAEAGKHDLYSAAEDAIKAILSVGGATAPKLHLATLTVEIYVPVTDAGKVEGEIRHNGTAEIKEEHDTPERYYYTVEIPPGSSEDLKERIAKITKGNYGFTLKSVNQVEPPAPSPQELSALRGVNPHDDSKLGRKEHHKTDELKTINRQAERTAKENTRQGGSTSELMGGGSES